MNQQTATDNSIPEGVLEEIIQAIASKEYGSVEIYIESGRVVQITERTIRKTERLNGQHQSGLRVYGNKR